MATGTFCGTGAWATAPKPGDPEGLITLTVTPAFGGIDVEWTYPGINPEAVAYGNLYRSTNGTDPDPVLHKVVTGNFFYDKTTTATAVEYFYWLELVSINGTVGDRVGPESAIARPPIADVIAGLTAQIDAGHLATSLSTKIDEIDSNWLANQQALADQAAVDDSLAVSFTQLTAYSDETRAIVQEEIVARAAADSAFVAQVNTVQTTLGDDIASAQTTLQANIDTVDGEVTNIGALYTAQVDVNGMVGGFGVYNDGTSVEAGFDVDRFWVGRTTLDKRKPFIIEGGETFIDEAVINKLTFDKLRAADGSLIVANGKVLASYIQADQLQVEWAKITGVDIQTADIANAAITNAKLGTASVSTLQIAGNAVTIPATVTAVDVGLTYYATKTIINSATYDCEGGGFIAMFHCDFDGADKDSSAYFRIYVNGSLKSTRYFKIRTSGGDTYFRIPAVLMYNGSGSYQNVSVSVTCQSGQDDTIYVRNPQITFLGARR